MDMHVQGEGAMRTHFCPWTGRGSLVGEHSSWGLEGGSTSGYAHYNAHNYSYRTSAICLIFI